jgi:hypothetical protein
LPKLFNAKSKPRLVAISVVSPLPAQRLKQQMIWTWAYAPEQGHNAWICDINGVLRLEQFIEAEGISYIVIDSAKSVSSAAGWSHTSIVITAGLHW